MSAPLVDMAKAVITNMGNSSVTAEERFGESHQWDMCDVLAEHTPAGEVRRSPPLVLSPPKVPLPSPLLPEQPMQQLGSKRSTPPSSSQLPSLVPTHKDKGIDVTIIVGKGPEQQAFPHNSHVLRYISDYFTEVMVHSSNSTSQHASSSLDEEPHNVHPSWIIDFSHKKVEEWKAFYPFLEPPAKRTVSLGIHNFPVLLPWFHEFQLPLLLHQCDTMLSSLFFPNLQQHPQPGDLQDCLLFLYAALSCNLPQTQQLGVQVLESYLRGAPHLFLLDGISTSTSSLQRLVILLQCFPHFQKQVWDPSIKRFLPPDIHACFDVDSPIGRDWMLQNPLFPFVLREGMSKYALKQSSQAAELCPESRHNSVQSDFRRDPRQTDASHTIIGNNISPANGRTARVNELDSPLKMKDSDFGLGWTMILEELSQGPHLVSSRANCIQQRNSCGSEEGQGADRSLAEESSHGVLEMSQFLGQQFWGAGWNLEPRASLEQEQRRLDRSHWLEEIVHNLKEHAQLEKQSSKRSQQQRMQNAWQGQHVPDQQGAEESHHLTAAQQHNPRSRESPVPLSNKQPSLRSCR